MIEPWIQAAGEGVVLSLHVAPRARRTEVVGLHGAARQNLAAVNRDL